ncbi:MAG: geranylgeranylglyceryl/heptaprenylglyceryl phosphate synthase [Flavobacteriales bacterium]
MLEQKPILTKLSRLNRGIALLIDPEKAMNEVLFARQLQAICAIGPDFIFMGGSTVNAEQMSRAIELTKASTSIPLIIFPGSTSQINTEADGLLFLSLISGRNPAFLIGQQVEAATLLFESNMEIISTGYMLVDGGINSAVARVSGTSPIAQENLNLITSTAKAGILLGMDCLYVDAGSGAKTTVSEEIIQHLSVLGRPLIIGGGIRNIHAVEKAHKAGANLVVIGNKLEEDTELVAALMRYKAQESV